MDDIKTAVAFEADFIAVSFPKNAADMYMARELMRAAGGHALMIAKIERFEAIGNLEEILKASPTASWSRVAISRSRSAMPRCRRCRSA
jgi:pyruvate kinase